MGDSLGLGLPGFVCGMVRFPLRALFKFLQDWELFTKAPKDELTRAIALGTWFSFAGDYAVCPEVLRESLAGVHRAATDYLIRLAEANGIEGTPLHHAGEVCRYIAKNQEFRDSKAESHLWPQCLGHYRYSLPQGQQDAIESGERVIQKLRLKLYNTKEPQTAFYLGDGLLQVGTDRAFFLMYLQLLK